MAFDLADYFDVKDRLAWFFERYPSGSVQSEIVERTETYVTIKAYAYRGFDDTLPGVGHATEPIPGKTPYTKDSEVMNAETSAWGRALAAIGAPTGKHIASKQEVKRTSPAGGPPAEGRGMAPQDGVPTKGAIGTPAGGTTSAEGEAAVEEPGEGGLASSSTSPGSTTCSHKGASGHWLKTTQVDGVPTCPRCGANAVIYRESG